MKKEVKQLKTCLRPTSSVVVSCRGKNGENNALAVAYACNCSYAPPMVMVGIVPDRHSYRMIKETGVFVVNVVTKETKDAFTYLGTHSGRDENKLDKLELNYENGVKVEAPVLLDFPINIECTVVDSIKTGSHEMFVGKVEYVHANSELVNENGEIDYSSLVF
ncbi:MAG: flavin reductase family protein [Halanaerobiales bacterium]|nr:flavin reductase family protein [Halanaerobiales bacterium]